MPFASDTALTSLGHNRQFPRSIHILGLPMMRPVFLSSRRFRPSTASAPRRQKSTDRALLQHELEQDALRALLIRFCPVRVAGCPVISGGDPLHALAFSTLSCVRTVLNCSSDIVRTSQLWSWKTRTGPHCAVLSRKILLCCAELRCILCRNARRLSRRKSSLRVLSLALRVRKL